MVSIAVAGCAGLPETARQQDTASDPSPHPPGPSADFYGSGIASDALGNITIGPHANQVSYRFRASHTGLVDKLHVYLIVDKAGYAAGTGGKLKIEIQTDDGTEKHLPSGMALGTTVIEDLLAAPQPDRSFPFISFAPAPQLSAGSLYHIVFSNADSSPTVNYASVDALYAASGSSPVQPTISDTDLAVLEAAAGLPWFLVRTHTPIYSIRYKDGSTEGYGYMEVWSSSAHEVSAAKSVRETFTVSGPDRHIASLALRVARTSGNGDLTVRVEQGDGAVLEEGKIPAERIPLNGFPEYVWAKYQFSGVRTLVSGQSYRLSFHAAADTTYLAFPIRQGGAYGFPKTTFFSDGYAEFTTGSGWTGWDMWGVENRKESDLQFYFTVVP